MASTWKGTSKKRRVQRPTQAAVTTTYRDADGRTHLTVQKINGNLVATGLTKPLFEEPWQDTMVLSTANAAIRHIGTTPAIAGVGNVAREAMDALSKLADGLAAQAAKSIACAAGCAHCCYQSVGATGMEVLAIVEHLQSRLDAAQLESVKAHIHAAHERSRGLPYSERFSPRHPCAFLGDGGRCTIYPVRPLVCRAMNSVNADECRDILYDDARRNAFLTEGHGPDSLMGAFRASHAMSAGLQLAGADVYGLDMRPLDMVAAVDELLRDPEAVRRWLSGQPAPSNAVGSDASSNARLRSIAGVGDPS